MIPTPGRIVEYTLTDLDAASINKRRNDAAKSGIAREESGAVVHFGNSVSEGDTYPLVITRVWGNTEGSAVNGQVLLDGNDTLWVTSATEGDGERHWRPFPRV